MRRWYMVFRGLGYVSGVLGLALFVAGYRAEPRREALLGAGGALLFVMFCAFVVTYVIFLASLMRRRSGGRRSAGARAAGEEQRE